MLDFFAIFTNGGVLLWSSSSLDSSSELVALLNVFILQLLETAIAPGTRLLLDSSHELQWTTSNAYGGVYFVAAYPKVLPLSYMPKLLDSVRSAFLKTYGEQMKEALESSDYPFDVQYSRLLRLAEEEASQTKVALQKRFEETKKFGRTDSVPVKERKDGGKTIEEQLSSERMARNLKKLKAKGAAGKNKTTPVGAASESIAARKGKQMRTWDDKTSKAEAASLDFSSSSAMDSETMEEEIPLDELVSGEGERPMLVRAQDGSLVVGEIEESSGDEGDNGDTYVSEGIWAKIKSLTADKQLTSADLSAAIAFMKEQLINKNVASEVAELIVKSVSEKLVGYHQGKFESVAKIVRQATESAVQQVLTPRSVVDILYEAVEAQKARRPYVMAFIGVNGVGKSTNLSKVCFWLLQNQLRVLIAACDTFRSGAVEQLRVHVRNLKRLGDPDAVELYERGYGKDSAAIAKDAIAHARANNYDVVLVDTAGRMQDNVPLMRALAKLVHVNQPDRIVFVGEALVGNEAIDQLQKFNAALRDFAPLGDASAAMQINGIILTKFDTIDDKVGAALSMTFISRVPILFIGVGQTYTDLRRMNLRSVVNTLLRP